MQKTDKNWPPQMGHNGRNGDRTPEEDVNYPPYVCNGMVCGFASEVREELTYIRTYMGRVHDRLTACEGYFDRLSSAVISTQRDVQDMRSFLRVLHLNESDQTYTTERDATERWLSRRRWKEEE